MWKVEALCCAICCCAAAIEDAPAALYNISSCGCMLVHTIDLSVVSGTQALIESTILHYRTTVWDAAVAVAADG
jgi:hypothetical protein